MGSHMAKTDWIRIFADAGQKQYRIMKALGEFEAPKSRKSLSTDCLRSPSRDASSIASTTRSAESSAARSRADVSGNTGDGLAAVPFKYINCVDFEFHNAEAIAPRSSACRARASQRRHASLLARRTIR